MPNPPLDPYGNSIPPSPGAKVIVSGTGVPSPLRNTLKLDTSITVTDSPSTDETRLSLSGVVTGPQSLAMDAFLRANLSTRGQGMIAETAPRSQVTFLGTIMATGAVYYNSISSGLLAGDVITNISVIVTVAGSGITASKVGLYTSAGVLVAQTADQGTGWQSTGVKTMALTAPYTVLASGLYYVAFFSTTATTMATLLRAFDASLAGSLASLAIGSGVKPFGIQTGQSDFPATATIASANAGATFWAGLS